MEKILLTLVITAIACGLFACSAPNTDEDAETQDPTEAPIQTADAPQTVTETLPIVIADADTVAAATTALHAILEDLSENYHPGTAGCSLTAARLAAALLDWNAAYPMTASEISDLAEAFFATLSEDATAMLKSEQLNGIYAAAPEILGDTAKDLLDSAGYVPTAYPYSQEAVETVFSGLYAGLGLSLPQG